jgi:hypothetical protein
MPGFLKDGKTGVAEEDQEVIEVPAEARLEEAVRLLSAQLGGAIQNGDYELQKNIQKVIEKLTSVTTLKKVYRSKDAHPALSKLRRNLGLRKIDPAAIEWGGSTWHFAPPPAPVSQWAAVAGEPNSLAYYDLKVSSNIVGLDNVPIYKVLGIDLVHYYKVSEDDEELIPVPAFQKYCDACNGEVGLEATECAQCKSKLDPFDMPLALRVRCAIEFHTFLQEEFGPYDELFQLVDLMNKKMPDKFFDKEELYPFLTQSSEAKTTST